MSTFSCHLRLGAFLFGVLLVAASVFLLLNLRAQDPLISNAAVTGDDGNDITSDLNANATPGCTYTLQGHTDGEGNAITNLTETPASNVDFTAVTIVVTDLLAVGEPNPKTRFEDPTYINDDAPGDDFLEVFSSLKVDPVKFLGVDAVTSGGSLEIELGSYSGILEKESIVSIETDNPNLAAYRALTPTQIFIEENEGDFAAGVFIRYYIYEATANMNKSINGIVSFTNKCCTSAISTDPDC